MAMRLLAREQRGTTVAPRKRFSRTWRDLKMKNYDQRPENEEVNLEQQYPKLARNVKEIMKASRNYEVYDTILCIDLASSSAESGSESDTPNSAEWTLPISGSHSSTHREGRARSHAHSTPCSSPSPIPQSISDSYSSSSSDSYSSSNNSSSSNSSSSGENNTVNNSITDRENSLDSDDDSSADS
ncbi:uncharacterized protein [Procambarus clarkii]|uniref:uncharacterized protein n=1 Tax=Procambarus clarkii TaxID=6728 RepID=UPI00374428EB